MPTLSHPLRHVARLALATLALLTLLLAPPTAAQELAADIELPELPKVAAPPPELLEQAEELSAPDLDPDSLGG